MTGARLPLEPAALLLRQISDGLLAGVPLPELLPLIGRSSSAVGRCRPVFDALVDDSASTTAVSAALGRFPRTFAPESVALIAAGERDGGAGPMLQLVAEELEGRAAWRRSLYGAAAWPLLIAGWALVLLTLVLIFVVPAFKEVFSNFGGDLPAPTLLLISVSDFVVRWWWALAAAGSVAAYLVYRRGFELLRRRALSRALLRVPLVRGFLAASFLARLGRLLVQVREGRLPLATALAYLRATTTNAVLADRARVLEAAVASGQELAEAVRTVLPTEGDLAIVLAIDRRHAEPGLVIRRALRAMEDELHRRRLRLQQGLLSAGYALAGILVGLFVFAMYLPIFKLGAVL